jgi:hypothetical protein
MGESTTSDDSGPEMTAGWSTRFHDGDRVEWIGPEKPDDPGYPRKGERGWVLSIDPPDDWAVSWDRAGTAVYGERYLRRVEDEPRRPPLAQYYRPAEGGPLVAVTGKCGYPLPESGKLCGKKATQTAAARITMEWNPSGDPAIVGTPWVMELCHEHFDEVTG